jgi:putative tryptophan/tyrosine transport system substrate-binding protein
VVRARALAIGACVLACASISAVPAAEKTVIYANVGGERVRQAFARLERAMDRIDTLRRHGARLRHEVVDNASQETLDADLKRIAAMKPDVIIATSVNIALAAQKATATIPVIFGGWHDPVEVGLVESFARPGRNLTGFTSFLALDEKRLEILKLCAPGARVVAVLADEIWAGQPHVREIVRAARDRHGLELRILVIETQATLQRHLASDAARSVDFWYVPHTKLPFESPDAVVQALENARKPAIYERSSYVEKGGMIAYQSDLDDVFEIWSTLVDRVLDGVPAAIIPIERPRHFELAVNLAAAGRLGVTIPRSIITRAHRFY